jgi:hypothetical protein
MTAPRLRSTVPPVRLPLRHRVWPRPALLRAMPLSTSPIAEGEAGAVCACPHIQLARRQEGEAFALHLGCTLDHCSRRPPDPSLLATEVRHHVGCAHRRCCVSSVSTVSDLCFNCFIWMLQVDLGCRICCKPMFQVFQVFQTYVSSVSPGCCICYYGSFQVFHMFQTHVTSVLFGCCKSRSRCCICCYDYTCMFQAYVSSVSSIFRRMLQMFHLDVSKVYLGEHMFHLPQPLYCYCWGTGAPSWVTCRCLRPVDASAARIRKRGKWLGSTWGSGMGTGCGCGMWTQGHWRWMGCGLESWDVRQDNAREVRPD